MQAATHLATGAALATAVPRRQSLAAGLAVLSHPVLDALSVATYHPADPLWHDTFWVIHQTGAWVVAVLTAMWLRGHTLVLLAAMVPDLDWLLQPFGLWEPESVHSLFAAVPGISSVVSGTERLLPDLTLEPLATFIELGLYGLLIVGLLRSKSRPKLSSGP
jgi:hypothetical protein